MPVDAGRLLCCDTFGEFDDANNEIPKNGRNGRGRRLAEEQFWRPVDGCHSQPARRARARAKSTSSQCFFSNDDDDDSHSAR